MVKYILKRILLAILILFCVSLIIYFLIRLMPLNYLEQKFAEQLNNGTMKQEDFDRILAIYGLADNSFLGILKGYWSWLTSFLSGDMGVSFQYGRDVTDVIRERMGISFSISLISLVLELLIAIPLGIKCATSQYGKFDYTVTVLCMIAMAFPSFFLGNLFIKWFAVDLGWFETGGLHSTLPITATPFEVFGDMIWHLILPILVMVILDIGSIMRYTRTNTLEVLNADYIRTARAKGLSEGKVVYKHVFRNTLIPLITVLASTLPMLFGGAMITETVFDIPGIGQAAYNALKVGDIPLAMGYNMFIAVLTVIGTLLADIMYAVVDPRVKLR
ncbi:MAG: ABC transporter permease [Clostridia bacterium]|nr:ABC transporter permease [Clostridia bacterium]